MGLGATPPLLPEWLSRSAPSAMSVRPDAPVAQGEHRRPGRVQPAVGDVDEIRREALAVGPHERGQARRPRLLLPLEDELHLQGQPARCSQPRPRRQHVGDQLPLVVAGAAAVEAAVAHGGLERRAGPRLQRIGRLHVVVPVAQQRERAPISRLADHHGLGRGVDHVGSHAEVAHDPGQQAGALLHTVVVGADAGLPHEGLEDLQGLVAVRVDVAVYGVDAHGSLPLASAVLRRGGAPPGARARGLPAHVARPVPGPHHGCGRRHARWDRRHSCLDQRYACWNRWYAHRNRWYACWGRRHARCDRRRVRPRGGTRPGPPRCCTARPAPQTVA